MREEQVAIGEQDGVADLAVARRIIIRPDHLAFPDDERTALFRLAGIKKVVLGQSTPGQHLWRGGGAIRALGLIGGEVSETQSDGENQEQMWLHEFWDDTQFLISFAGWVAGARFVPGAAGWRNDRSIASFGSVETGWSRQSQRIISGNIAPPCFWP